MESIEKRIWFMPYVLLVGVCVPIFVVCSFFFFSSLEDKK